MPLWLDAFTAVVLFLVGLRLSAFFSGAETGFYRLSLQRLFIDSKAGDKRAKQLLWFSEHPAYFVSTCLIGNNVANYLTTAAIGWGALAFLGYTTETIEVVTTLLFAPIIFQFGELLPKSVYYLAPVSRLQHDIRWFRYFFRVFLPLSYPLVLLTRAFEKLSGQQNQPTEIVLGRSRFVQLMQHGREEGALTALQSRLANGLLHLAPSSVTKSMIPESRVLGLSEQSTREEVSEFARQFAIPAVAVHRAADPHDWFGYITISELITSRVTKPMIHPMPVLTHTTSKLEALHKLQCTQATYATIRQNGVTIGIIARNGLIEQIYRPEISHASTINP